MHASKNIIYFIFLLLTIAVNAHAHAPGNGEPGCAHHLFNETAELLDVEEEPFYADERLLATASYPAIRIQADYTRMTVGTQAFKSYVQNDLLPPVLDYFKAALKVKKPLTSNLKISSSTICGYTTPTALKNGVATDFFVVVTSTTDSTSNWVASAGACSLSSATHRPLVARMQYNTYYTASTKNVLAHEKNMYLTIHEMFHAFGFAASSFKYFIDASGNTLTGHIKSILLNGSYRTVIDVEPLTTKLRNHFGCSSLEGAYMEDDGGAGTEGSHFERRHFIYDTMTSGVIDGRRVSEFDLAMLEGSGWYVPDYTYAEPFFFGQGQGCNFLKQPCSSSSFSFPEFSSTTGKRSCTNVGRGGGLTSADSRSDLCIFSLPNSNYDCEDTGSSSYARYPEIQVFGREVGSKCFDGTLTRLSSSAQTTFCFKYTCSGSGLSTQLSVTIGKTAVKCTKEGQISVSGYNGRLNCPDPLTFCNTVAKKYCPRGCLGRGTCVSGQCKCKTGYTGVDCALGASWSSISS